MIIFHIYPYLYKHCFGMLESLKPFLTACLQSYNKVRKGKFTLLIQTLCEG